MPSGQVMGQKIFDEIVEIIEQYIGDIRTSKNDFYSTRQHTIKKIIDEGSIELDNLKTFRESLMVFDESGIDRISKIKEYLLRSLDQSVRDDILRLEWAYKSSRTVYDRLRSRRLIILEQGMVQDESGTGYLLSETSGYTETLRSVYFFCIMPYATAA